MRLPVHVPAGQAAEDAAAVAAARRGLGEQVPTERLWAELTGTVGVDRARALWWQVLSGGDAGAQT